MQALRNFYTVVENQIIIELPESFNHKSVEVIILPLNDFLKTEKEDISDKTKNLDKLLSISVWSDQDVQTIYNSQNFINQWEIEKF